MKSLLRVLLGTALLAFVSFGVAAPGVPALKSLPQGLSAIAAAQPEADRAILAVAMLGHAPTALDVSRLQAQGLVVQPFKHLPMALTKGTLAQLLRAQASGAARDFYRDEALSYHSAESTAAMHADATRALGYDGAGIGIAIVDSGIDASHPVLKNRVVHNVRVYSPEYIDVLGVSQLGVNLPSSPALVIPFDALPYNNTDTIGHGTHVAGLAAGDGTDNPELIGVAPGAHLVGYSTGEVLFIFTALASFDDILDIKDQYNIRVINNSWGSAFQVFDPDAPINVATKTLHDAGITVVFSAGNSSDEMTTGPNSNAPWVINVCSGTIDKNKSSFSSAGLMYDNTDSVPLDADRHQHFDGDSLGITHPDVCAPGSSIVGPGTPTGLVATTGTPPGGEATLSGTSMAAPHVTGAVAVLLQANPALTPDQVREVLQVTAVPMADESQFWQTGYGWVDLKAAVDLATSKDFSQAKLDALQVAADQKFLAARPYQVVASDHWIFTELLGSVGGSTTNTYTFEVKPETQSIRSSISFPGDLSILLGNFVFNWSLELKDPDGKVVATSESLSGATGVSGMQYDSPEVGKSLKAGTWTLTASGDVYVAEPALVWGNLISVSVTQLAANTPPAQPSKLALAAAPGRFGGAFGWAGLLLFLPALMRRRHG